MQRLYSIFPTGTLGGALLLLRLTTAGIYLYVVLDRTSSSYAIWVSWAQFPIIISLAIGLLTPFCSVFCVLYLLAIVFSNVGCTAIIPFPGVANAIALIFLGPGAYSLDSLMFGRKVIKFSKDLK